MKWITIVFTALALFIAAGCSKAPQAVSQDSNTSPNSNRSDRPLTAIAHTTENRAQPPVGAANDAPKSKWTQGGEPIDTKQFDESIKSAEKALAAKPSDDATKKALGGAYFKRAVALTEPEARQYASALGDFRKAYKYDPSNGEAKEWIEKITGIYQGMGKDFPKEGEEPPPLPFPKGK